MSDNIDAIRVKVSASDAAFIALPRVDVVSLLAEVDRLHLQLAQLASTTLRAQSATAYHARQQHLIEVEMARVRASEEQEDGEGTELSSA